MTKSRGAVHRDGDWHGALHVWVGGIDERDRPFAVFQRRSATKDTWPGTLDVAVGGHLRAGETLAEALREADEEIGLSLEIDDLHLLGRRWRRGAPGAGGIADNEIQHAYAVRSDLPLTAYRLHPDEVDAVVAVPLDAAVAMFSGSVPTAAGIELRRGAAAPVAVEVAMAGFAGGEVDDYALRALRGLMRLLAGEAPEPFALR